MRSFVLALLSLGIVVAGFILAQKFVGPSLPEELTFAAGRSAGRYADFARELKRRFEAHTGATLQIVETEGLVENQELVSMAEGGADLALVMGGVNATDDKEDGVGAVELASLGTVFLEPVWVFLRVGSTPVELVRDLKGKRIAIGTLESPERSIALSVLGANGISPDTPDTGTFVDIGGKEAAIALAKDEVDAAFFVAAIGSELLKALFETPGLAMIELRQAAAYRTARPSLAPVLIGEGLVDLALHLPPTGMETVAEAVTLVGKPTIPRKFIPVLISEAQAILMSGGILERPGQFPSPEFSTIPVDAEAANYYRTRAPSLLLYRLLPFRVASAVERYWVLALPLLLLVIPFLVSLLPLWRWELRSKIYKHYRELQDVDRRIAKNDASLDPSEEMKKLQKLRESLLGLRTPLAYADRLYNLQLHLNLVINRLKLMASRQDATGQAREE